MATTLVDDKWRRGDNRIQRINNAVTFRVEFPETSRAINFIEGAADATAEAIFKPYKQHANEVGEALDSRGRQAFPRLHRSSEQISEGALRPLPFLSAIDKSIPRNRSTKASPA